jgi:hypothetical protein
MRFGTNGVLEKPRGGLPAIPLWHMQHPSALLVMLLPR